MICEVARTVMKQVDINREDIATSPNLSLDLQKAILEAQLTHEIIAENENGWYISDRSGIDPIVYARVFTGTEAAEELLVSNSWLKLKRRMKQGLVFVCVQVYVCVWKRADSVPVAKHCWRAHSRWAGCPGASRKAVVMERWGGSSGDLMGTGAMPQTV